MKRLRFAAGLTLLAPVAALAQEHEGMPQLNFYNPLTVDQIIWMAVIFVLLWLALSRWGLPQIETVLVQRASSIAADLDVARNAKAEADAAVAELTEATRRAHAEAQASITGAVEQARREAATRAAELNARLEAQLAQAEQQIAQARTAAMGALNQVALDTAEAMVQRLTGRPADRAALEQAVGTALAARAAA